MRSLLFVPADSERKLAKATTSGADVLLLDLEDSVALPRKAAARAMARDFLKSRPEGTRFFVRINPLSSGLAPDDLDAILAGGPDGIMLPKAAGADDIRLLSAMLQERGASETVRILPIVTETARAMFGLHTYAGSSSRLVALMWGAEDLAADIGAVANKRADGAYEAPFALARSLCLFAAAAAGLPAIDTVYTDFRDLAGLEREAKEAARLGFSGKAAIHPDQVAVINRVFTPDAETVGWARKVVAAFAAAPDSGVVGLDGAMLDRPHLLAAQRILSRAGIRA